MCAAAAAWVILCTVLSTGGALQVRGQVGHSVDLQCVVPAPNISQWGTLRLFLQRRVPSADPKVVYSFSNGQEQPDHQDGAYRNRCRLSKDNLTVSLSHISPSDEGDYDCKIFLQKPRGYELEHSGQMLLSVWADYLKPQISVFRDGADLTAVCTSNSGYPRGQIEWISNSAILDLRNKTKTWADHNPQTLLYNISESLTLTRPTMGSIHCCVVAGNRRVCSDKAGIPQHITSGAGGQDTGPVLTCLSLALPLTLYSVARAGAGAAG